MQRKKPTTRQQRAEGERVGVWGAELKKKICNEKYQPKRKDTKDISTQNKRKLTHYNITLQRKKLRKYNTRKINNK